MILDRVTASLICRICVVMTSLHRLTQICLHLWTCSLKSYWYQLTCSLHNDIYQQTCNITWQIVSCLPNLNEILICIQFRPKNTCTIFIHPSVIFFWIRHLVGLCALQGGAQLEWKQKFGTTVKFKKEMPFY